MVITNEGIHPIVDLTVRVEHVLMAGSRVLMFSGSPAPGQITISFHNGPTQLVEGATLGAFTAPSTPAPDHTISRLEPHRSHTVSLQDELAKAVRDAESNRKLKRPDVPPDAPVEAYLAIIVTYHRAVDHGRSTWTQEVAAVGDGTSSARLLALYNFADATREALRSELRRWRSATAESSGTAAPQ